MSHVTSEPGPRVLLVVATLGRRPEYLEQTLASIRDQDVASDIVIVAPDTPQIRQTADRWHASWLPDPESLPEAINVGAGLLAPHHDYINWLNDDDLLEPGSLHATCQALDSDAGAVLAFGACRYIDEDGRELWISRAGKWAPRILKWGPDLIPQPGMLVRADAWRALGGVDAGFKFAFDLDLLLRLQPLGQFIDVGRVVSSFRWHATSLTVDDRSTSLQESEKARRRALGPGARRCAWIWERPVRAATRAAAWEVSRRAARIRQRAT